MKRSLDEILEDEQQLEMTPMIDVTFLLLIFFLCTIRFKTLEGKLSAYLPKESGVNARAAEEVEKIEIGVFCDAFGERRSVEDASLSYGGEGPFLLVGHEVSYRVGRLAYTDLEAVEARVRELHALDPERPATIDARPGVVYADVVGVLDAVRLAGVDEISFVGTRE